MSMIRLPDQTCDCGQKAYKKDGGGWYCEDCKEWTAMISRLIDDVIRSQRGYSLEENQLRRRAYWKEYKIKNYRRILEHQRMKAQSKSPALS